ESLRDNRRGELWEAGDEMSDDALLCGIAWRASAVQNVASEVEDARVRRGTVALGNRNGPINVAAILARSTHRGHICAIDREGRDDLDQRAANAVQREVAGIAGRLGDARQCRGQQIQIAGER